MWRIVSAKWSLSIRWDPQIVHTISVSSPPLIKTIHSPNKVIKINISQQIIDAHELLCVFKKKIFYPRNGEFLSDVSFLLNVNVVWKYFCRSWGWYAFSLIATMDSKPKFWIIIKEKLYRCVWFDINTFDKALIIKSWYKSIYDRSM